MGLAFISVAALTVAAQWHVDGDARCEAGDGSERAPYCEIQAAFDGAALAPGDEIIIHEAATLYGEASVADVDGEADAAIVIRPATGEAPILGGGLSIFRSSHWTVRGLTFDGAASSERSAIFVNGSGDAVEGITIEDNTIDNWGGDMGSGGVDSGVITARTDGTDPGSTLRDVQIRRNRVVDGRGKAIYVRDASEVAVEHNTIQRERCQRNGDGNSGGGMQWRTVGSSGVYLRVVSSASVSSNRIQDFDISTCHDEAEPFDIEDPIFAAVGVFVREGTGVEVSRNFIERMGIGAQGQEGMGVNIRGGQDTTVHHNVVVEANGCGLCSGARVDRGGQRPRFIANTVLGGDRYAIDIDEPEAAVVVGNIMSGAAIAQLRLFSTDQSPEDPTDLSWTIENNLYDIPDGAAVGRMNFTTDHDIESWPGACGCDQDSALADPMLSTDPEDFTVAATSLAVDFGGLRMPEIEGFNGAAPDCGALESPLLETAAIAEDDPDRIELTFDNQGAGGLGVDPGCGGFSVQADGAQVRATECTAPGDQVLIIRLERSVYAGESIQLDYDGRSLTDQAAIAGTINARVHAFGVEVDNASQTEAPEGTSSGGTTDGSGDATTQAESSTETTGSSTTDGSPTMTASTDTEAGAAGDYPAADGCTCAAQSSPTHWAWALLGLLVVRRRRRAARF